LKFVLSCLPVYFISFFKAPTSKISSLESLFKCFFFWSAGGSKDYRKIAWVDWDSICLPKEEGGLGLRRLLQFNLSLLGKWCWRILNEQDGPWYRVFKARYGEEGGQLKEGGADYSVWWKMVSGIRSGVGTRKGSWFEENVRRVVGSGGNTLFWTHNWVGEHPLRDCYPCRFDLAADRGVTVAEMSRSGGSVGVEETPLCVGGGEC